MNKTSRVIFWIWICFFPLLVACSSLELEPTIDCSKATNSENEKTEETEETEETDYSYLLNKSICLIENDIVAFDDSLFYISRDLGRTWNPGPKLDKGQIVRLAYLFNDGTLFYCTDEKCFFSSDYNIVEQSSVYDIDGQVFVPSSPFHSFSAYEHDAKRVILEDREILCWGNYNNEEPVNPGFVSRIWLTYDKGKTVRCSFKFGTSRIDNSVINARHVHSVNYNQYDSTFWASTGDDQSTSHWLKGVFNSKLGEINWELIGTGLDYKTGNMQFYKNWIYASNDSQPGGVFRIKYDEATDMSRKESLFQTPNDCLSVYVGKSGDILAIMTTTGGGYNPRNIYYSTDQKSFTKVEAPIPDYLLGYGYSIFYNTWGITNDGYILTGIRTRGKTPLSKWNLLPSLWLNDVI